MGNTGQQLILQFGGDASGANEAIQDLVSNLGSIATSLQDLQQGSLDFGSAVGGAVAEAGTVFDGLKEGATGAGEVTSGFFSNFLQDAHAAISEVGVEFKDFGEKVGDFVENPLHHAGEEIKHIIEGLGDFGAGLLAIGAAAGAVVGALYEIGSSAAETGEKIHEFSVMTSLSIEQTEKLKYVADVGGSSLDQMRAMAFTLQRQLNATGAAQEKMNKGLDDLGISAEVFRAAKLPEQVLMLSEGLNRGAASGNNMAAAVEVLGMRGRQFLPFLSKDLADIAKGADDAALKLSEDDVRASEQFEQASRQLKEMLANLGTEIGMTLVPALTLVVEVAGRTATALVHIADLGGLVSGSFHLITGALGDNALAAQTAAVHQETITKALAEGAPKGITYGDAVKYINDKWNEAHGKAPEIIENQKKFTAAWGEYASALSKGGTSLKGVSAATRGLVKDMEDLKISHEHIAAATGLDIAQIDELIKQQKDAATAAKAHAKVMEELDSVGGKWQDTLKTIDGSIEQAVEYYLKAGVSQGTLEKAYGLTSVQVKAVADSIKDETVAHKALDKILIDEASPALADFSSKLEHLGEHIDFAALAKVREHLIRIEQVEPGVTAALMGIGIKSKPSMEDYAVSVGHAGMALITLEKDAEALPGILIKAFEGGGNISGAMNALFTKMTSDVLGPKGPLAGVTGAVNKAVMGITSGLGSTVSGLLGSTVSAAIPGIGALIGPAIGSLFSAIGNIGGPSKSELQSRSDRDSFMKQFSGFDDMMTKVGASLGSIGQNGDQAAASIGRMLDAKNPAAFSAALQPITDAMNAQKGAQTDINALITKYKFSIDELGPALSKQKLDEQAQQLYKDWSELKAAGIDISTVTQHMSTDIQSYFTNALKTGAEVPTAMEPMLQQMVKMGTLTDQNGNIVDDLGKSGVTFSVTMTEGFKSIVDSVHELTLVLSHELGGAISATSAQLQNLPKHVDVAVDISSQVVPDFSNPMGAATGGIVMRRGVLYAGSGGRVPLPMGADTIPAMLSPGELILNAAQQSNVASQLQSGGGTIVHNDFRGSFIRDTASMQELAEIIVDALSEKTRSIAPLSLRSTS